MSQTNKSVTDEKAKLLPRLTGFFFDRPRPTLLIWLVLLVFGVFSYTTLLRREGFPSVSIPIVIVNGVLPTDTAADVDRDLAAPLSQLALKQGGAQSVSTSSEDNFFNAVIQYEEGTDTEQAEQALRQAVETDDSIPAAAELTFNAPYFGVTGGSTEKIDATIALYDDEDNLSVQQLTDRAEEAVGFLNSQNLTNVERFFVADPFQEVTNPVTGQSAVVQRTFDRFVERHEGSTEAFRSVIINVAAAEDVDVIELDAEIRSLLDQLNEQEQFSGISTAVTASYAPAIEEQISELQRVLLEGLIAVLIVGSFVIAVRASIITVISMLTVIAITLGVIYLLGYTLNVITLFALILGLSLIVDDTIIMIEAIDAARRRHKDRRVAVREATRKIGRAMIAATLTAALSFVPLLFVSGILGSFIRAIPVTIIAALLISLVVALVFIPLFARYLLLGPKLMGEGNVKEIGAGVEARIVKGITWPMRWAKHHRRREFVVGITAVLIGIAFVGAGGFIFQKVAFNIFPPSKDTNQLAVNITFQAGTSIEQAQNIVEQVEARTTDILGGELEQASYYGMANARSATLYAELIPYGEREPTAPELTNRLEEQLSSVSGATVDAYPVDVGPPTSSFVIDIDATNRPVAEQLAADMAEYLDGLQLERPSGEVARITEASISNVGVYERTDGEPVISVSASFDGTDTTTLTTLAQDAVTDYYDQERLQQFGLEPDDISFDLGQEAENQESFQALLIAFPAVLLAIYILLVIQFRSLLQPLLIFLALPFSFFGIALGLYLTDNAFSFFAMLGFFALIGLSIKNTILLTDYANQARRSGMGPVDAAIGALSERFRPLIATSFTAVFSLIPLAIVSPFWQGLAVVLIFGLLSSTLLVVTVFPYYYLVGEYLRIKASRLLRRMVSRG